MMLAQAPVVLPELGYMIVLFFAICGYLVARGLLASWTHTLGYLLQWLARHARVNVNLIIRRVTIDLGGAFRAADNAVQDALKAWARGAEIEIGYCLHGMATVAEWTAAEVESFATATASMFQWFEHDHLPWLFRVHTRPIAREAHAARTAAAQATQAAQAGVAPKSVTVSRLNVRVTYKTAPELTRRLTRDEALLHRTAARVESLGGTIALPHPGAITRPADLWRGLTRRAARIERRLRRVETLFGVGVFAVAMANVLGVPSWRCLTKGPVGRVSRALCGMSGRALSDLLGLLADLFLITHICDVIALMEEGLSLIEGPINDLIAGADRMFVECGYDLPAHREPRTLYLPATVQTQLYLP